MKGKNTVAAEVYRNSDGSFLEAQDMYRLPGIFRTVALYATPKVQIRDLQVIPDYQNGSGSLDVTVNLRNLNSKKAALTNYKIRYSLFANKLYSDETYFVKSSEVSVGAEKAKTILNPNEQINLKKSVLNYTDIKPWSAEEPNRYVLVAELMDKKQ